MTAVLYHATTLDIERLDPQRTRDGGLHAGTRAQARMRGGPHARLLAIEVDPARARRSRDSGGRWAGKITSARTAGYDAIVYLNRYEGVALESVLRARKDGIDLDRLTDAEFRRRVPEASDSWIILRPDGFRRRPELDESPATRKQTVAVPAAAEQAPDRQTVRSRVRSTTR